MTDERDVDRLARRARHATTKLAHEVTDGATTLVDEGRATARKAFLKVKAARAKAAKRSK